ncbi:hypothetical protein DTO166G4_7111 [Paecilomyces variotii]|nr:hypothetical protein DTO166G4_7111 [Paecilomyces variotii]KAJ9241855.1 hypothetical protein DTO166G5_931 [Paecilomyces variotii]
MRVTYPLLLLFGSAGQAATRRHVFTIQSKPLSPDGVLREGYLINGQFPGPLIEAEEGDTVEVLVRNEASVSNTIHWHGILQKGTPQMDGVPGVTQEPIAPGASFLYRFSLHDQYGPYWYHSHYRAYYGDGISGPFIIHPSPNRTRSFRSLASNTDEYERLLHVERSAQFVMVNDWRHQQSDQVLGEYLTTGNYPFCVDSLLINGKARIECLTEDMLRVLSQELIVPSQNLSLQGCTKPMMLRDGFDARDFQTQSCLNTTSDLTVIMADPSEGWLALHLANTGLVSDISFSIDGHSMIVYAVDGIYVDLSEVQVTLESLNVMKYAY